MSLEDFVNAAPGRHPAHNRMVRHLASDAPRAWLGGAYPATCCMGTIARDTTVAWARTAGGDGLAANVSAALRTLAREEPVFSDEGGLPRSIGEAELRVALRRLADEFVAVGVLERAAESAALFEHTLGWTRAWANRTSRAAGTGRWAPDARGRGGRRTRVSAALAARIYQLNALDTALYAAANALLSERLERLTKPRTSSSRKFRRFAGNSMN